jgi:hypothetical protein
MNTLMFCVDKLCIIHKQTHSPTQLHKLSWSCNCCSYFIKTNTDEIIFVIETHKVDGHWKQKLKPEKLTMFTLEYYPVHFFQVTT